MWQSIQKNWKTNLVAVLSFLYTIPQVVTAVQQFMNHQTIDWHSVISGVLVTGGMAVAKDFDNHTVVQGGQGGQVGTDAQPQLWKPKGAK